MHSPLHCAKSWQLGVREKLLAFSIAAGRVHTGKKSGSYHLIILDLDQKQVTITTYGKGNLELDVQVFLP